MRRASLVAGAGILLVGSARCNVRLGCGSALARIVPRSPARPTPRPRADGVLTTATSSAQFRGWERRDQTAQFLWDLLFYEPWFLGLGVLVSLATLHHYRRTGGSARGGRLLMLMTAAATVAITAFACALVVMRSP